MKPIKLKFIVLFLLCAVCLPSCEKWNTPQGIDLTLQDPEGQDPALYEQYMQALRAYKQTTHPLVFGMLENAPQVSISEKDFMRGLPDSLDLVVLCRADKLSAFDIEDMPLMKRKGTKVLYYIDLADFQAALSSSGELPQELTARLDKAISDLRSYDFDGFTLAANIDMSGTDAELEALRRHAATITGRLRAGMGTGTGKVLLFEGNPLFFHEAERVQYDYFVLKTDDLKHIEQVESLIRYAHEYASVPLSKLFITATPLGTILAYDNAVSSTLNEMVRMVFAAGSLAGVGVYQIGEDYYDPKMNYLRTKEAIQTLNPSH